MTDAVTGVNQDDYMKLFMQELTYQDPLKPIDNREFMTQMAQFSALQQAKDTNENLEQQIKLLTVNQSVMLLGKSVQFNGGEASGKVVSINFPDKKPAQLSVDTGKGSPIKITLGDVTGVY